MYSQTVVLQITSLIPPCSSWFVRRHVKIQQNRFNAIVLKSKMPSISNICIRTFSCKLSVVDLEYSIKPWQKSFHKPVYGSTKLHLWQRHFTEIPDMTWLAFISVSLLKECTWIKNPRPRLAAIDTHTLHAHAHKESKFHTTAIVRKLT